MGADNPTGLALHRAQAGDGGVLAAQQGVRAAQVLAGRLFERAVRVPHQFQAPHQAGLTCAYMRDVLERLPTQPASRVDELLPHRWQPTTPT